MAGKKRNDTDSFMIGMLVGLFTGGFISFWMSPRSGEQTREELQKIVVTIGNQAQSRVKSVVGRGQDEPKRDQNTIWIHSEKLTPTDDDTSSSSSSA